MSRLLSVLREAMRLTAAWLATTWWLFVLVGLGFWAAFQYVEPAPSRHLVFSAGVEGGAYHRFALQYAEILAVQGIQVEVRTSAGSLQNLDRLSRGESDVAFVQGGGREKDEAAITLGSVFYEPVWVFTRGERRLERLTQLSGRRIAVGSEGSGVRQLAMKLLAANAMDGGRTTLLPLSGQAAVDAMRKGDVDAVILISAPESPLIQGLLRSPGIQLLNFAEADAYLKHFGYLSKLRLPRGSVDLAQMIPAEDVQLLAATAHLAVREDLHPALQILLLQAATRIHGDAGFFRAHGEFPAYKDPSVPLSPEASRFYQSGAPFLQRYLPFWLAVLVDRMVVLLVPLFALLLPLFKVAPALYRWRIRSRIFRLYGELKFLENDVRGSRNVDERAVFLRRLDEIEEGANALSIPIGFADLLYTLRSHVQLVREHLLRKSA